MYRPEACVVCKEPLPEGKGRVRWTCSDACKQARYRRKKGVVSRRVQRVVKETLKRRAMTFMERSFNQENIKPIKELGHRRHVYECVICGQPYLVERIGKSRPPRRFCSEQCENKAQHRWIHFKKALARADEVDDLVWKRMGLGRLSPLCAHCGTPFGPNVSVDGTRMRGRPRKYCSTACGKAAYEKRWKQRYERARVHRFRECAECGTWMDRTDSAGRRIRVFCTHECAVAFGGRAAYLRRKMRKRGKGDFRRGSSGHGMAARLAPKNLRKAEQRNRLMQIFSGEAEQNGVRLSKPAEWMRIQTAKQVTFMSEGVLGIWALQVRLN